MAARETDRTDVGLNSIVFGFSAPTTYYLLQAQTPISCPLQEELRERSFARWGCFQSSILPHAVQLNA